MNTMDIHASLNNLVQMDRHQEEIHRIPIVHQTANADYEREEAAKRIEMPNQPEQPEAKNADSEANKRYHRETPRRKRQMKRMARHGKADGAGRFVDITV